MNCFAWIAWNVEMLDVFEDLSTESEIHKDQDTIYGPVVLDFKSLSNTQQHK